MILKDDASMDAKNIMKKQPTWGGSRKNSGRKPNKKTGTKIVWLGMRWKPDVLKDVKRAIELVGTKNNSSFVMDASGKEARMILKKSNYDVNTYTPFSETGTTK